MRYCPECKQTKPHADFYVAKSRPTNLSVYCRECTRIRCKRWSRTKRAKALFNDKALRAYKAHPEKHRARAKLKYAVKMGKISKPSNCSSCSEETTIHGHHEDYSKPYEVIWLCQLCHKAVHNKITSPELLTLTSKLERS